MKNSSKLQAILLALLLPSFVNCQAKCVPKTKALQCSTDPKDCSSILVCGDTDVPTATLKCQSSSPYCTKGDSNDFCGTVVDPAKESCAPKTSFKCVQSGLFPDLNDCSIFYSCYTDIIGKDAPASSCFPGSFFSLSDQKCSTAATCTKLTCTAEGLYPHPTFPEYYYGCSVDADKKVLLSHIFKCTKGEKFSSTFGCQYNCSGPGYFPHEDKTKFYSCISQNGGYKSTVLKCSAGLVFKQELLSCGPENKAVVKPLLPPKK